MSRELKFRTWGMVGMNKPFTLQEISTFEAPTDGTKVLSREWPDGTIFMQYTGLKDKHGKEIYDSDLLKHNDKIFRVLWDEQRAQWACKQVSSRNRIYGSIKCV